MKTKNKINYNNLFLPSGFRYIYIDFLNNRNTNNKFHLSNNTENNY